MKPSIFFSAFLVGAVLAGCVSTGNGLSGASSVRNSAQSIGMSQEQVRSARGEPFAVYTYPEGSSWFYNIALRDMQRDRVLFDQAGLLIRAEPAWSHANFEQVEVNSWTSSQLQQNFGPPVRQERPRTSIIESFTDAPPPATSAKDEELAASRNWIYGYRQYNRYFIVAITVNAKGVVSAIEIAEDPNNPNM